MRLDPATLEQSTALPALSAFDGASVLVTGASGSIGSAFAELLLAAKAGGRAVDIVLAGRDGAALRARFADAPAPWTFEPYDAMRPWRGSRPFDFVLHAAAPAHPSAIATKPVETLRAIVDGTADILAHAATTQARRLLFVSSSEVYGTPPGKETPWREDELGAVPLLAPRSCYPQGKRAAETLCAATAAETGLDFVVVRPGHVYGPTITAADSRAHAQFARAAAAGEPIVMKSRGEQRRSYVHSLDAATALATLLARGVNGEAYNLAGAEITTVREMAEAFASAGRVPIRFEIPTDDEAAGYNPMSMSALDGSRLLSLGWSPVHDMRSGARDTVACLRKRPVRAGVGTWIPERPVQPSA